MVRANEKTSHGGLVCAVIVIGGAVGALPMARETFLEVGGSGEDGGVYRMDAAVVLTRVP